MTVRGMWLVCLVVSPAPHLWIADQVRNDVMMLVCLVSPSAPVSGTGTGFDSSAIIGRGGYGWCWLLSCCGTPPPCGYCLEASMTVPGDLQAWDDALHRFHPHL